jgi:putative flippase GtrA
VSALHRSILASSVARYLLTGGVTFLVDLGLLVLLHGVLGMPVAPATALAYAGAIAVNFFTNSTWTFAAGAHSVAFLRYMAVIVANLLAAVVIVDLLVRAGAFYVLAKTVATVASTLWTYPISRLWVYRD